MKKLLSIVLACIMMFGCISVLASCSGNNSDTPVTTTASNNANGGETTKDSDYVKNKGKLIVGITDFAPMDYQDESGKWIGFDADMATKFAESLGVAVEFVPIEWGQKVAELDGRTIDVVWNGMTLNDETRGGMECSEAYCKNSQAIILPSDIADNYKTTDDCKSLTFAVESGSAGEEVAQELGFNVTPVVDQATALLEVASGSCDAAIIDVLMAGAMIGEGTSYANLVATQNLNSEEYGVGFRKGSDLAELLNAFFKACREDGTMQTVAEKYGVQAAVYCK